MNNRLAWARKTLRSLYDQHAKEAMSLSHAKRRADS